MNGNIVSKSSDVPITTEKVESWQLPPSPTICASDDFLQNNSEEFLQNDQDLVSQYQAYVDGRNTEYTFEGDNKFMNDPEALQKGIDLFNKGDLPSAIKALEAAVQQHPTNSMAWTKLGLAQAENDQDVLAIKALKKAIETDPQNLDAHVALAVSYTNEYQMQRAIEVLHAWIHKNPKYTQFAAATDIGLVQNDVDESHRRTVNLFIAAAKQAAPTQLDPDVHGALGLLYNLSFEYDKAIACFRAALTQRPEDYLLWNKLGATTANSPAGKARASEPIDAYFRALDKKPSYTRARSNLGISYMSVGDYPEAAKCFLGALTINNAPHLWDNLRTALTSMQRFDLVNVTLKRDPELFRGEFDF